MVTYSLEPSKDVVPFVVDPQYGTVKVGPAVTFSREKTEYTIFLRAKDNPKNPSEMRTNVAVIHVAMNSANLHAPKFITAPLEFWVGAQVPIGTIVGQIKAHDEDGDAIAFDLLHKYREGVPFAIEESSGIIAVWDAVDSYDRLEYFFDAVITDGNHTVTQGATIHVVLPDQNDLVDLGPYTFDLAENLEVGTVVGKFNVKTNRMISLRFEVVGVAKERFAVDSEGVMTTLTVLDREEKSNYEFTVLVENERNRKHLEGVVQVTVNVLDRNDNAPKFGSSEYEVHIAENSPKGTTVSINPSIVVTDADELESAMFQLFLEGDGKENFSLDLDRMVLVQDVDGLDREEQDIYNLLLRAVQTSELQSVANLTVYVDDVNDNEPTLIFEPSNSTDPELRRMDENEISDSPVTVLTSYIDGNVIIDIGENFPVGEKIGRVRGLDPDSGNNGKISYRLSFEASRPARLHASSVSSDSVGPTAEMLVAKASRYFKMDHESGEIVLLKPLVPETKAAIRAGLPVETEDAGLPLETEDAGLPLETDDAGLPVETEDAGLPLVTEDADLPLETEDAGLPVMEGDYAAPIAVGRVTATDSDFDENGKILYSIENRNSSLDPLLDLSTRHPPRVRRSAEEEGVDPFLISTVEASEMESREELVEDQGLMVAVERTSESAPMDSSSAPELGDLPALGLNQLDPHAILPLHNFSKSIFRVPSVPFPVERFFDAASCYRWLRLNFSASIIFSTCYIIAIFALQAFMRTKRPMKLKVPLFLWNLGLALFSMLGTHRMLPWTIKEWATYGFHRVVCMARIDDPLVALWEFFFTTSKIVELGDTLFLVLRKRPVIFLHWYHHAATLVFVWWSVVADAAVVRTFSCMNFLVHAIMYTYFALRALSIRIPLAISMSITAMQIIQMILGLIITAFAIYYKRTIGCDFPPSAPWLAALMYGSYLVLFWRFFSETYGRSGKKAVTSERKVQ
ncbi:unnamed protein product [Cyprideis torosa]|uniref:Uncharacterized protein n=1 Tax=Cyprideis torosa TaxID=163714 RepID=A0A7R8ZK26_9CRUS|nr:unnamed protein product [Cyprideis torosa]CAG0888403.1 unnamed protein product [Cyprideis torosa]